jgi:hypothetical protein
VRTIFSSVCQFVISSVRLSFRYLVPTTKPFLGFFWYLVQGYQKSFSKCISRENGLTEFLPAPHTLWSNCVIFGAESTHLIALKISAGTATVSLRMWTNPCLILPTVVFRFCFGSQHGTCWLPKQKLDLPLIWTIVKIYTTKISACYGQVYTLLLTNVIISADILCKHFAPCNIQSMFYTSFIDDQ